MIYNLTYDRNNVQFLVGGYLASGAKVQMSTNLTILQTVQTIAASPNLSAFSTKSTLDMCRFFRVQ